MSYIISFPALAIVIAAYLLLGMGGQLERGVKSADGRFLQFHLDAVFPVRP